MYQCSQSRAKVKGDNVLSPFRVKNTTTRWRDLHRHPSWHFANRKERLLCASIHEEAR